MKKLVSALALTIVALGAAILAPARAQEAGSLDYDGLKKAFGELGYETKDVGSANAPKFQFTVERGTFTLPVGCELSGSKAYIWLSLVLERDVTPDKLSAAKARSLLVANSQIQPSQFYITTGNVLMIALAVENRGMNNAALRRHLERLATQVVDNASIWQAR